MRIPRKEKYLTEKDILKWNDKFEESDFRFSIRFNTLTGYNDIEIISKPEVANIHMGFNKSVILDPNNLPKIKYRYTFSVVKERSDYFFTILNNLLKEEIFITKHFINDQHKKDIIINDDIFNIEENEHTLQKREFIRYTYNFEGDILQIISYISYIEDAIGYFQLIWGYDENGKEISLPNFPVSSIVSDKNDASKDYMVIDYEFYKNIDMEYSFHYVLLEILNENSPIINYGSELVINGYSLMYSRNHRINTLLN